MGTCLICLCSVSGSNPCARSAFFSSDSFFLPLVDYNASTFIVSEYNVHKSLFPVCELQVFATWLILLAVLQLLMESLAVKTAWNN